MSAKRTEPGGMEEVELAEPAGLATGGKVAVEDDATSGGGEKDDKAKADAGSVPLRKLFRFADAKGANRHRSERSNSTPTISNLSLIHI